MPYYGHRAINKVFAHGMYNLGSYSFIVCLVKFVCVCVCIYIYIYIYVSVSTYILIHMYTYICMHIYVCMYVCLAMHANMRNKERDREIHRGAVLASQKMPF